MGWNSQAFNKSLFSTESYMGAIGDGEKNGYAVLKIIPERLRSGSGANGKNIEDLDYAIVGVIQNPLKFDIKAEWGEMDGLSALIPNGKLSTFAGLINSGVNAAGFGSLGEVYASRKIYKKSGYLGISADLKIVNWDNDGAPVNSALAISRLLLSDSRYGKDLQEKIITGATDLANAVIEPLKDGLDARIEEGGMAGNALGAVKNLATEGAKHVSNFMGDVTKSPTANQAYQNTLKGIDDYALLRASPSTVTIQIGDYFVQSDMIIEDASFTFSKEITRTGPLYVDISLTFSSRTIMGDVTDLGLLVKYDSKERVSFVDGKGSFKTY